MAGDEITALIESDPHGPWPDKGTPVACQHDDEFFVGNVKLVFLAMDVVAITVTKPDGTDRHLFREFGDKCVPVAELFRSARAGRMLHPDPE